MTHMHRSHERMRMFLRGFLIGPAVANSEANNSETSMRTLPLMLALASGICTDGPLPGPQSIDDTLAVIGLRPAAGPLDGFADGKYVVTTRFLDSTRSYVVTKTGGSVTVTVSAGYQRNLTVPLEADGTFFIDDTRRDVRFPSSSNRHSGRVTVEGGALVVRATQDVVNLDRDDSTGEVRGVISKKHWDWQGAVRADGTPVPSTFVQKEIELTGTREAWISTTGQAAPEAVRGKVTLLSDRPGSIFLRLEAGIASGSNVLVPVRADGSFSHSESNGASTLTIEGNLSSNAVTLMTTLEGSIGTWKSTFSGGF